MHLSFVEVVEKLIRNRAGDCKREKGFLSSFANYGESTPFVLTDLSPSTLLLLSHPASSVLQPDLSPWFGVLPDPHILILLLPLCQFALSISLIPLLPIVSSSELLVWSPTFFPTTTSLQCCLSLEDHHHTPAILYFNFPSSPVNLHCMLLLFPLLSFLSLLHHLVRLSWHRLCKHFNVWEALS